MVFFYFLFPPDLLGTIYDKYFGSILFLLYSNDLKSLCYKIIYLSSSDNSFGSDEKEVNSSIVYESESGTGYASVSPFIGLLGESALEDENFLLISETLKLVTYPVCD